MHGEGVTGTLLGVGDRHSHLLHGTAQRSHTVSLNHREPLGLGITVYATALVRSRGKQLPKA